jgi:predicted nucleotidyltransferase
MRFGLREEVIEKIQCVFTTFPTIEEVIIYGSRAMGTFKPGSDIDLTLKGKELNLSTLNSVEIRLDELILPYIFDISLYNHIENQDLLDHIQRVGITLYKNPD